MPRPTTALLDRARIGRAALALVDKRGDFTVPELAKSLGVQPSSLYHHVSGRGEIIDLLRAEVLGRLDHSSLSKPGLSWREAFAAWARSYRHTFAAHPAAIHLLATAPVRSPEAVDAYEQATALLLRAGFPTRMLLPVMVSLENYLLGSALDAAAPAEMIGGVDPDRHPILVEATSVAPSGGARAEETFEVGLEALLDGYAAWLARQD